jgi:predicted Rossmann fold nucleotide-binding protein DprA/Smf involved in DNA uptake
MGLKSCQLRRERLWYRRKWWNPAQRNLMLEEGLNPTAKKLYELLSAEESRHIDDLVETSGLNSSDVLATLFDLEMRGIVRHLPGKQFSKVLL